MNLIIFNVTEVYLDFNSMSLQGRMKDNERQMPIRMRREKVGSLQEKGHRRRMYCQQPPCCRECGH